MDRYLMAVTTCEADGEEHAEIWIDANSFDEACQLVRDDLEQRGIQVVYLCGGCVSSANDSDVNPPQRTRIAF